VVYKINRHVVALLMIDVVQGHDIPNVAYGGFSQDKINFCITTILLGCIADNVITKELLKQIRS
jgi:hypothetical protein